REQGIRPGAPDRRAAAVRRARRADRPLLVELPRPAPDARAAGHPARGGPAPAHDRLRQVEVGAGVAEAASDPNRPEPARRARPLRVALLLGIASFVLHMGFAGWLAARGALRPINLFFDADCGWFLDEFATGEVGPPSYGPRCLIHPNVANLIEPPIALVAAVGERVVGRTGSDLL